MRPPIRGTADRARWLLITAGGLGLAPFAPGTFGTLAGVAIGGLVQAANPALGLPILGVIVVALTWFGFRQTRFTERAFGCEDPGAFVLDEVVGYLLALTIAWAFVGPPGLWVHVATFAAFRVFDIAKLEPARRLESLPGAPGIMLDDLAAGCQAGIVIIGGLALGWIPA